MVFFILLGYRYLTFIYLDVFCIIFHLSALSINIQYNTIQYNSYIPKTIHIFILLLMCFDLENVRIMHFVASYLYVLPYNISITEAVQSNVLQLTITFNEA